MGRKTSDERLERIRRDLTVRLPYVYSGQDMDYGARLRAADELLDVVMEKGRRKDRALVDRAMIAVQALADARDQDSAEKRRDDHHIGVWIDRWLLRVSDEGLTGSESGQEALRARLLVRQRDIDRRRDIRHDGGKAMRLVLTKDQTWQLKVLAQILGTGSQQATIERLIADAYQRREDKVSDHIEAVLDGKATETDLDLLPIERAILNAEKRNKVSGDA